MPGAAQVFRLDRHTNHLRAGQVLKTTTESIYGFTTLWAEEASPQRLLALVRDYWAIEIKQHYRRDHTQREDHCLVREHVTARNLSLMRSVAIFLYEQQRAKPNGKQSLPDWQRKNSRLPLPLIHWFNRSDH
jgi:predicted transposase YbfD/YdcC